MKKQLTSSLEKYLLAVYEITKENQAARVKDVSNYLKIGAPATSDAIKTLAKKGFINYIPYGIITMTEKGKKKAVEKIFRHEKIMAFFQNVLNLDEENAQKSADSIEYSLPEIALSRFISFLDFQSCCSCKTPKWKQSYDYYSKNDEFKTCCQECMKNPDQCSCCNKI